MAYVATLLANTARILIAMSLHDGWLAAPLGNMDPAAVHRIEGIVVYVSVLLVMAVLATRWDVNAQTHVPGKRITPRRRALAQVTACIGVPLCIYLAIAVVIPLWRAEQISHAMWQHALIVTGAVLAFGVVALAVAAAKVTRRRQQTSAVCDTL